MLQVPDREVGALQLRIAQRYGDENGVLQARTPQTRSGQVRSAHPGAVESRPVEKRTLESSAAQHRVSQIGPAQVGSSEIGAREVRALKVPPCQRDPSEICARDLDARGKLRLCQLVSAQIRIVDSEPCQVRARE